MYHRAALFGAEFQGSDRMKYEVKFTDDIETESQLITLNATYTLVRKSYVLGFNAGADFFASATGTGYFGQYRGDDRVRGAISYGF